MANTETSYRCSVCGVSSDNKAQALIHATGPLHSRLSFNQLYPDSPEAQQEKVAQAVLIEKK